MYEIIMGATESKPKPLMITYPKESMLETTPYTKLIVADIYDKDLISSQITNKTVKNIFDGEEFQAKMPGNQHKIVFIDKKCNKIEMITIIKNTALVGEMVMAITID